jgi:hypothetical protein
MVENLVGLSQLVYVIPAAAEFAHQGILTLDVTMPEILESCENRAIDVNRCPGARRERDAAEVFAPQVHTIGDA